MSTWYIDSINGSDLNSGMEEDAPLKQIPFEHICPGDTVLLKCGSVFKYALLSPSGEPDKPIHWSSYGEGENPVFCGSAEADSVADWEEVDENIWKWVNPVRDEIGNIIFNKGQSYGTLRWTLDDLQELGDWYFTHYAREGQIPEGDTPELYLYTPRNPGVYYENIDIALFGARRLASAEHDVIIENMIFRNSAVHGFAATNSARIKILNCRFENIGGCAWNEERRIRFGNGVELWQAAKDICVENCSFYQIYDSCFTPQGDGDYPVPENLIFRNCNCQYYGMAAYEVREVMPKNAVFEKNDCSFAGVGFAMQGEILPRRSEIWPQPMGHHVFIWNMKRSVRDGSMFIRNNTFGSVPHGSVVYSIVDDFEQKQVHYSGNQYMVENPEKAFYIGDRYIERL